MYSHRMSQYSELIRQLYKVSLFHPPKVGLTSMMSIYKMIGKPLDHIPVIHVAGTNGKGSVATKIANVLKTSGLRTGLYTSPHIATFRERIQIDGNNISAAEVEEILPDVIEKCEANGISATFFELTTALAFRKFVESNCDVVVLEVGLGGRLDATNVIGKPALSVITAIQYDHMATLGDSLEDIAAEKGGIIKPDSVYGVLVGPGCPHDVLQQRTFDVSKDLHYYSIDNEALLAPSDRLYPLLTKDPPTDVGSRPGVVGRPFDVLSKADIDYLNTDIARSAINILSGDNFFYERNNAIIDESYILIRRYQMLNDHLAALSPEQLTKALSVRPQCRFECLRVSSNNGVLALESETESGSGAAVDVVLDLAHNHGAIMSLLEKLARVYSDDDGDDPVRFRFVLGMAADKDVRTCVEAIHASGILSTDSSESGNQIYCVEAQHPRALSRDELQELVRNVMGEQVGEVLSAPEQKDDNVALTLQRLVAMGQENQVAGGPKEVVVVFGSAFIMADCKKALGCYNITSPTGKVTINTDLVDDFELY